VVISHNRVQRTVMDQVPRHERQSSQWSCVAFRAKLIDSRTL